jgi:hypothetical protein
MSYRPLIANRRRSSSMCLLHELLLMLLMMLMQSLLLLLLVVGLRTSGYLGILFREDADDPSGYFVVNNGFIVFSNDVDTKFLEYITQNQDTTLAGYKLTTISSLLSSKGSDSWPSTLSLSPLINVPFELFTSLM